MKKIDTKNTNKVTLESIDARLLRIEERLSTKEKNTEKEKEWKDIKDIIGILLLAGGLIYLFVTGGVGAIVDWFKNFLIPG
jgi:5-methylcytosine-specific restriction endonuclease McrBC GTP-binding regulatory subunit McrB